MNVLLTIALFGIEILLERYVGWRVSALIRGRLKCHAQPLQGGQRPRHGRPRFPIED